MMDTFEELEALAARGEGVNPYREVYMSQVALEIARYILRDIQELAIQEPGFVSPTLDGGVHLEWDRDTATFCIDIDPDENVGLFIFDSVRKLYWEQDGLDRGEAQAYLEDFMHGEVWSEWNDRDVSV